MDEHCRNCAGLVESRLYGLCLPCWYQDHIQALYKPRFLPTPAPPGSIRKLFAIRRRVRLRQPLVHPADAKAVDGDCFAADIAFGTAESIMPQTTLAELLRAARREERVHVEMMRAKYAGLKANRVDDLWPGDDSSAPDWLAKELARWRARLAARAAGVAYTPDAEATTRARFAVYGNAPAERRPRVYRAQFRRERFTAAAAR